MGSGRLLIAEGGFDPSKQRRSECLFGWLEELVKEPQRFFGMESGIVPTSGSELELGQWQERLREVGEEPATALDFDRAFDKGIG